jgi:hypothetical protein
MKSWINVIIIIVAAFFFTMGIASTCGAALPINAEACMMPVNPLRGLKPAASGTLHIATSLRLLAYVPFNN